MTHSPITLSAEENALRSELASTLEKSRVALAGFPELNAHSGEEAIASASSQLDAISALLSEAIRLNGLLDSLENLSVEGGRVAAATVVATSVLADLLALMKAGIDELLVA